MDDDRQSLKQESSLAFCLPGKGADGAMDRKQSSMQWDNTGSMDLSISVAHEGADRIWDWRSKVFIIIIISQGRLHYTNDGTNAPWKK